VDINLVKQPDRENHLGLIASTLYYILAGINSVNKKDLVGGPQVSLARHLQSEVLHSPSE
jgi:hypothetical protein